MSAAQIIEQINALPTVDRLEVALFARAFRPERMLTGDELALIAQRLADANDPEEIAALKDALRWGWYGPAGPDADAETSPRKTSRDAAGPPGRAHS